MSLRDTNDYTLEKRVENNLLLDFIEGGEIVIQRKYSYTQYIVSMSAEKSWNP